MSLISCLCLVWTVIASVPLWLRYLCWDIFKEVMSSGCKCWSESQTWVNIREMEMLSAPRWVTLPGKKCDIFDFLILWECVCASLSACVCVFQLIREGMEWENKRTRERWRGKSDGFLGFPASSVLLCAISWIIGPCQTGSTSGTVNLPDARTDF